MGLDQILTHKQKQVLHSYLHDDWKIMILSGAFRAGKTVMTVRRNIVQPLKQIARAIGIEIVEHRSENYLELIYGNVTNYVYLFGGKIFATYL